MCPYTSRSTTIHLNHAISKRFSNNLNSFLSAEDLCHHLLQQWIDFPSIVALDTAITNRGTRILWLQRLHSLRTDNLDKKIHEYRSLMWLIARGVRRSNLLSIRFDYFPRILDSHISIIAPGCHALQSVGLGCGAHITDGSLSNLGNECPPLEIIDLHGCEEITDIGVMALIRGCPGIRDINLYDCTHIGDTNIGTGARMSSSRDIYLP